MNRRTRPSACCAGPARVVQTAREVPVATESTESRESAKAPAFFKEDPFPAWQEEENAAPLLSLAIMTVPFQRADFARVYSPEQALGAGTLFTELELPFLGCGR